MENAGSRLLDEFRAEASARGVEIPGALSEDVRGSDLRQPAIDSDLRGLFDPTEDDPPFEVRGGSRWMVFQRKRGKIYYYAAPILAGAAAEGETGEVDEACGEHGTLASVGDAVALTSAYLAGAPPREIAVPRQGMRNRGVTILCVECGYRTPGELAFVEEIRRSSGPSLLDELRAELAARGLGLPGELVVCGGFADFGGWPRAYDQDEVFVREYLDPAFELIGYARWVVLARIAGEIRCYAAPIPLGGDTWRSVTDPSRDAAIRAARDEPRMLAMLTSVPDAVTLACEYLGGAPLDGIAVTRLPQPWYG